MAIHHFDLARCFTGADALNVYAKEFNPAGSWYRGAAAAECLFELTGGVVFSYRGSWCAQGFPTSWNGSWRLVGERGTLLYEADRPPRAELVSGRKGFTRRVREVRVPVPAMEATAWHGALREMLGCLRTGRRPQTDCRDNLKSLAMVFAALESSRRGRRVPVRA
jgi:predicted dehydrogenase